MSSIKDVFNNPAKYDLTEDNFLLVEFSDMQASEECCRGLVKPYNAMAEDLPVSVVIPNWTLDDFGITFDDLKEGSAFKVLFMPPNVKEDGTIECGVMALQKTLNEAETPRALPKQNKQNKL